MKDLDLGIVVTIVAFGLFYFRLLWVRRNKRRALRELALQVKKQGKGSKMPLDEEHRPGYEITSWWLVAIAAILMILGMWARQNTGFPVWAQEYWWLGTSVGALMFAFCFK